MSEIRAANRALNLLEYEQGRARLESLPRYVMVELTQGCNLHCSMCRPEVISPKARRMPDALFDQIERELFPTAEWVDLRGWGESLILEGVIPLIERTVAAGPRVRFVSNLSFRRPAVLDALIRHRVLIGVSLDSADAEVLSELRAGASLDLITANLRYLTEGYRRSHGTAEDVYLTVTVQRPALTGLPALVDLAASCGIGEIRLFPVSAPEESPLALGLSSKEVSRALDIAVEAAQRAGIRLVAGARLGEMPVKDPLSPACVHPWSYATISWDGLVGFCDHLIGPDGAPYGLGQWQHESFQDIWNGPAWVTLREEHLGQRREGAPCFHECAWCYRNRHTDFEHLLFPQERERIRRLA
jgi:MoaA/NifB/PqqE/SkfB family radical SAM enzyme